MPLPDIFKAGRPEKTDPHDHNPHQAVIDEIVTRQRDVSNHLRNLKQQIEQATRIPGRERAKQTLALLPFVGKALALRPELGQKVRGELRKSLFLQQQNLQRLYIEGNKRAEYHAQLTKLTEEAEADPTDPERINDLEAFLMQRAAEVLGLGPEYKPSELFSSLLENSSPESKATRATGIIADAREQLAFSHPLEIAGQSAFNTALATLRKTMLNYDNALAIGEPTDAILAATEQASAATRLNLTSGPALINQVEIAIQAAEAAVLALVAAEESEKRLNPRLIERLQQKALRLSAPTSSRLLTTPIPTSNPDSN